MKSEEKLRKEEKEFQMMWNMIMRQNCQIYHQGNNFEPYYQSGFDN